MKKAINRIVAAIMFILGGGVFLFPMGFISFFLVISIPQKLALFTLLIGLGITLYGLVQAVRAIWRQQFWWPAIWGIIVSFGYALFAESYTIMGQVK